MREFEADIGRDGTVYHLAWEGHGPTARHYNLPENTSAHRQNFFEYDLRAPFIDNLGLQERGIEDPPEVVVQAAERLTHKLRNWHQGRDLRSIPKDWGDVVEHVYENRGTRTPKYLNGRGGVYFTGELDEVTEGRINRLLGSAVIHRLAGNASIAQMWGRAHIEEMTDDACVESTWQAARIGTMSGRSQVNMMCQSSSVGEMRDESRVLIMHGATRIEAVYGRTFCVRGADGSVNTPDRTIEAERILSEHERWQSVQLITEGESVYA